MSGLLEPHQAHVCLRSSTAVVSSAFDTLLPVPELQLCSLKQSSPANLSMVPLPTLPNVAASHITLFYMLKHSGHLRMTCLPLLSLPQYYLQKYIALIYLVIMHL